jgi:tripartite-type tricarboxylate transporter receptor subunit TctC
MIRLVIPYPPGGGTDTIMRPFVRYLSERLGQQVVIDNRGGAGGLIGMQAVARAAPDGYTIGVGLTAQLAVNPSLYKSLPYDPVKDFAPITLFATGPYLLAVHPSLPVKSVKEFVDYARKHPDEITYGSAGNGSGAHLAGELLKTMTGIKMLHVPYKGGGPANTAVLGGEVQAHFPAPSVGIPHIKAGRLRGIGFTGAKRLEALPDVQTIGETVKGFVFDSGWHAVFAPKGTPMAVVTRMQQAIHKALQVPHVHKHFTSNGYVPQGDPPAVWAKKFKEELKRYDEFARLAGIERF